MNIFEALEVGDGKATKQIFSNCYLVDGEKKHAFIDSKDCLIWNTGRYVPFEEIKGTDWIPYFSHEPTKRNYQKVFDGVTCSLVNGNEIKFGLPALIAYQVKELVGKPSMKMTLEWTE